MPLDSNDRLRYCVARCLQYINAGVKVVRTQTLDIKGLGKAIKAARENDERPLTEICSLIQMTTSNWYRIESENQSLPIDTLRKIEEILGVSFGVSFDEF